MNLSMKKNGKSNKGFYIALGVCLIAVGTAAWTTYSSVSDYTAPQKAQSEAAKTNNTVSGIFVTESAPASSSAPVSSEKPVSRAASSKPVVSQPAKQTAAEPASFSRPVSGGVTQAFSKKPVFCKTLGDYRAHTGTDLSARSGETVKSAADGVVTKVGSDALLGNIVVVKHGSVEAWYCGLDKMSVKAQQSVTRGQQLGTVGVDPMESDENPHLHLVMKKDGQYIDPMSVLK